MTVSSSRPDHASPAAVAGASFGISRKGFDPDEVRAFLRAVSAEMTRLEQQVATLQRDLAARQDDGTAAPVQLDEDTVTALLGAAPAVSGRVSHPIWLEENPEPVRRDDTLVEPLFYATARWVFHTTA